MESQFKYFSSSASHFCESLMQVRAALNKSSHFGFTAFRLFSKQRLEAVDEVAGLPRAELGRQRDGGAAAAEVEVLAGVLADVVGPHRVDEELGLLLLAVRNLVFE